MDTKERLEPLHNGQIDLKIKNAYNMPKTTLLAHYSISMQKTALKTANIPETRPF